MSLRKIVFAGFLPIVGAGAFACVSTEDVPPADPPDPYGTQNLFCSELAKVQCNDAIVQACYQSLTEDDRTDCINAAQASQACVTSVVPTDSSAGMTYVSTNAPGCIAKASEAYADARVTLAEQEAMFEACVGVFHRGASTGQPCDYDSDCATVDGLRCIVKPGVPNACAIPEEVGGGENCEGTGAVCIDGQYCSPDVGACLAAPKQTDDCGPTVPCAEGLICSGGDTDGFCLAKKKAGEACASAEECATGFCVYATGADNGTCRADKLYDVAFETCDEVR